MRPKSPRAQPPPAPTIRSWIAPSYTRAGRCAAVTRESTWPLPANRRQHPRQQPVLEHIMVIECGKRMRERDDHDRPTKIFVHRMQQVPCRPARGTVRSRNTEQTEELYRMALRPSECETGR